MCQRIVLVSCGRKKLKIRAEAKDMYIGTLFRMNMSYAEKLQPDEVYILSAKYGLLKPNQKINPYDITLNNMSTFDRKEWAGKVIKQLEKVSTLEKTEYIFLAGEKYRGNILPHISNFKIPLKGLGIGKQLKKLKELTG